MLFLPRHSFMKRTLSVSAHGPPPPLRSSRQPPSSWHQRALLCTHANYIQRIVWYFPRCYNLFRHFIRANAHVVSLLFLQIATGDSWATDVVRPLVDYPQADLIMDTHLVQACPSPALPLLSFTDLVTKLIRGGCLRCSSARMSSSFLLCS
jgi:hypothetical protein